MIWTPSRIKIKTCRRAEELLVSQRPFISDARLCVDVLLQLGYFLFGVGGRICTPATIKSFIPQNVQKAKINLRTHSVGVLPMQLPSAGQLTG